MHPTIANAFLLSTSFKFSANSVLFGDNPAKLPLSDTGNEGFLATMREAKIFGTDRNIAYVFYSNHQIAGGSANEHGTIFSYVGAGGLGDAFLGWVNFDKAEFTATQVTDTPDAGPVASNYVTISFAETG